MSKSLLWVKFALRLNQNSTYFDSKFPLFPGHKRRQSKLLFYVKTDFTYNIFTSNKIKYGLSPWVLWSTQFKFDCTITASLHVAMWHVFFKLFEIQHTVFISSFLTWSTSNSLESLPDFVPLHCSMIISWTNCL